MQPASTTSPDPRTLIVDAFRALAAASSAAELLLGADGEIHAANSAAARLLGQRRSELEGANLRRWLEAPEKALDEVLKPMSRAAAAVPGALAVKGADGATVNCRAEGGRVVVRPLPMAETLLRLRLKPTDESRSTFSVLTRQVVDLRHEVARRRHAELLLEHQKGLLERIVGNHALADVLHAIASFIEDHSEHCLCSILLLSDDGKRLSFGAAPSLPAAYNAAIDGIEIGPRVGSCGTAAYLGETVTVVDIASDPRWADFKELAAEHDLAACWSEPVKGPDGEILATLAMYYREPVSPTADDVYLTSIGVDLTAIAILSEKSRATLRQRAEQLAEADRRKDRFLAMLSHELRNPLAPIVNTLSILSNESDDPRLLEHVARLERQTTHLSRLVDDLLDISRIAHGAVELKIARVDLRDCIAQAVDSVRDLVEERRQSLRVPEAAEPMWVDGDHDRLRQVFANLLTNAAKYTPRRGAIEVELAHADGAVVCRVRDNGQGLTTEVRRHLFEPFSQGARSALDSRQGLGLGLTLVKQLVECHGGVVEVESAGAGEGSEFTVKLPASAGGDGAESTEPLPVDNKVPPLEVLLVEDNKDSAEALAILLELWGHKPRVCFDGDSAIEAAMEQRPDVLLFDIDLPGRDGYSVLRSLRQRGFSTDNRLAIAMTGFGRLQDMEKSASVGFHHHMTKPADPTVLRRMLGEFAVGRRSG